jgi:hypothetical protein
LLDNSVVSELPDELLAGFEAWTGREGQPKDWVSGIFGLAGLQSFEALRPRC